MRSARSEFGPSKPRSRSRTEILMIRGIACKGCYYVATLDPPPPLFGSGRLSTQRGETFSKIRPERKKKRASARRWMFRGFRARLFMCFCARTLCMMQLISVQILLVAFFVVVLFCIVALARAQSLQFLRETRNILIGIFAQELSLGCRSRNVFG